MKVMQTLMGGGASFFNGDPGKGLQSWLYLRVMIEYDSVQSFSAFSTVHEDTGLFGIQLAMYYFKERFDLVQFARVVKDAGLYLMLRIGLFVPAEWNFRDVPAWLHCIYVPRFPDGQ